MSAGAMAALSGAHKPLLPVLLLMASSLSGCFLFPQPPPPPGPGFNVVDSLHAVPGLDLRLDHRFGFVRVSGDALAYPVEADGKELGAVYLGVSVHWRFDAIFQVRERTLTGDLFVEAPAGEWEGQRAAQQWRNATPSDLVSVGLGDAGAAFARAQKPVPTNFSRPQEGLWTVNGTIAAQVRPQNFTLALEEGPLVFLRNDTGFIVVENRTLVNWDVKNHVLYAQNDALVNAKLLDPEAARLDLQWSRARVDIHLVTPPFRRADLVEDDDPIGHIIAITLPRVVEMGMTKYVSAQREEGKVELRSANMTLTMAPP